MKRFASHTFTCSISFSKGAKPGNNVRVVDETDVNSNLPNQLLWMFITGGGEDTGKKILRWDEEIPRMILVL